MFIYLLGILLQSKNKQLITYRDDYKTKTYKKLQKCIDK